MALSIVYLFLQLIAVVSVLICGVYDTSQYAWVPFAVIISYAVLAWRTSDEDATELESQADQVYFVGYLCTITAFAGIALHGWKTEKVFSDPRQILFMVSVALLTTVAGLLAMIILKNHARRIRQDFSLATLDRSESGLKVVGAQAGSSEVSRRLTDIINKAAQSIEGLNRQLESLKTNIEKLRSNVDQGADAAQQFADNVKQLQTALDGVVLFLERKLDLEGELDTERAYVVQQFVEDVKQLRNVLNEFALLLEHKIALEVARNDGFPSLLDHKLDPKYQPDVEKV